MNSHKQRRDLGQVPPWNYDPQPELWVRVGVACKWFRLGRKRINQLCNNGDFEGVYRTYFDGFRWYIRLPRLPDVSEPESNKANPAPLVK